MSLNFEYVPAFDWNAYGNRNMSPAVLARSKQSRKPNELLRKNVTIPFKMVCNLMLKNQESQQ